LHTPADGSRAIRCATTAVVRTGPRVPDEDRKNRAWVKLPSQTRQGRSRPVLAIRLAAPRTKHEYTYSRVSPDLVRTTASLSLSLSRKAAARCSTRLHSEESSKSLVCAQRYLPLQHKHTRRQCAKPTAATNRKDSSNALAAFCAPIRRTDLGPHNGILLASATTPRICTLFP